MISLLLDFQHFLLFLFLVRLIHSFCISIPVLVSFALVLSIPSVLAPALVEKA